MSASASRTSRVGARVGRRRISCRAVRRCVDAGGRRRMSRISLGSGPGRPFGGPGTPGSGSPGQLCEERGPNRCDGLLFGEALLVGLGDQVADCALEEGGEVGGVGFDVLHGFGSCVVRRAHVIIQPHSAHLVNHIPHISSESFAMNPNRVQREHKPSVTWDYQEQTIAPCCSCGWFGVARKYWPPVNKRDAYISADMHIERMLEDS